MKKIALGSFVLMVMLVVGVSALVLDGDSSTSASTNSESAKSDYSEATDALAELEDTATSGADKCKAYAKVQWHCNKILNYDDDSSDKDDSSSDGNSDDNVSDYQSKAQALLDKAEAAMKVCMKMKPLNCEKEIKCQEMKHRFAYNINGDDDSRRKKFQSECEDDESSDDGSSDDGSSDDESSKDGSSDDESSKDGSSKDGSSK